MRRQAPAQRLWRALISIHAPLAGCDVSDPERAKYYSWISIHAPLAGCDRTGYAGRAGVHGISIHAPLAGCDLRLAIIPSITVYISIHAPLAGCDQGISSLTLCFLPFQSTHPLRGATFAISFTKYFTVLFQSTHPLRGATKQWKRNYGTQLFQSTHPLRGATDGGDYYGGQFNDFNPRTPCGVRLPYLLHPRETGSISIHAPLAGCDGVAAHLAALAVKISIHAPLAGCDCRSRGSGPYCATYFNPRTPCGVRRTTFTSSRRRARFQSTHPLRGATNRFRSCGGASPFQSTHPLRGATSRRMAIAFSACNFNPRTPCGVRLTFFYRPLANNCISIHAPLAGCDCPSRR